MRRVGFSAYTVQRSSGRGTKSARKFIKKSLNSSHRARVKTNYPPKKIRPVRRVNRMTASKEQPSSVDLKDIIDIFQFPPIDKCEQISMSYKKLDL